MPRPLDSARIVVTRPAHQAQALVDLLVEQGATVSALAMIDIKFVGVSDWPEYDLEQIDMLIFVSRNAVNGFVAGHSEAVPDRVRCVAVGAATANCMTEHGLVADIVAPPPAGSESLLALQAMQNVAGYQVMIVRGDSGRELLADTLMERGANIAYLPVYRRCLPDYNADDLAVILASDWLVVTSVAGLENLCQLVNDAKLMDKNLVVVSERIGQVATTLGFHNIVVTDDVSDEAVVKRIVEIGQSNGKEC